MGVWRPNFSIVDVAIHANRLVSSASILRVFLSSRRSITRSSQAGGGGGLIVIFSWPRVAITLRTTGHPASGRQVVATPMDFSSSRGSHRQDRALKRSLLRLTADNMIPRIDYLHYRDTDLSVGPQDREIHQSIGEGNLPNTSVRGLSHKMQSLIQSKTHELHRNIVSYRFFLPEEVDIAVSPALFMLSWQHGALLSIVCSLLLLGPHSGSLPRVTQQEVARINA